MPTFINPFHSNPMQHTMKQTLTDALCNQRPADITVYIEKLQALAQGQVLQRAPTTGYRRAAARWR